MSSVILVMKVCTAFATNFWVGGPGECVSARWSQHEYATVAQCEAAYKRFRANNWIEYRYMGVLVDRRMTVNLIRRAECREN